MRLNTKISASVSLLLFVAMLISSAAFIYRGYENFNDDVRNEAENSLAIFQAVLVQAMLHRRTTQDQDPVIIALDGTLDQLSRNKDRFSLWVSMAPKVVAYQKKMGNDDIELPVDDIDREAFETGMTVGRMSGSDIYRLSIPMVLGQGDAASEKCFECHGKLMGIKNGEVIGVYSIALSVADLWANFMGVVKTAAIATAAISILISGICILLLNRLVSGPISVMTGSMRKLAGGDTKVEISGLGRKDEIGEMAEAVKVFKGNALELIFQKYALDEHAIVSSTDVKGNITYVNDKFCEISGYSRKELLGRNHRVLKSDEHSTEFYKDLWRTVTQGKPWHGNVKNLRKDGSGYWVKGTIVPFIDDRGKPFQYVSIRTDITEQLQAEELRVIAHRDALTELPNRYLFEDRLTLAIAQSKRLNASFALLYIDLDKFKPINDTLGHGAGDAVLKEVAKRLEACVRETDTAARVGGDEFAIILAAPVPSEISRRIGEKILEELSKPIYVEGHGDCTIGASIGISVYPTDATNEEALIKCADAAMYKVKESGRNSIRYFGNDPT